MGILMQFLNSVETWIKKNSKQNKEKKTPSKSSTKQNKLFKRKKKYTQRQRFNNGGRSTHTNQPLQSNSCLIMAVLLLKLSFLHFPLEEYGRLELAGQCCFFSYLFFYGSGEYLLCNKSSPVIQPQEELLITILCTQTTLPVNFQAMDPISDSKLC